MFSKADLEQFRKRNIPIEKIEEQILNFKRGFPFVRLAAAATPGNGIMVLKEEEVRRLEKEFDRKSDEYQITKMVPASGAASRMFKNIHTYIDDPDSDPGKDVLEVIEKLEQFAFYNELTDKLAINGYDIHELLSKKDHKTILKHILLEEGLNYAALPKGLLLFHQYPSGPRTPLEEHMQEGIRYSCDSDQCVHLHFTVSPEHREGFEEKAAEASGMIMKKQNLRFDISYSEQKPSTDTIAVDLDNEPFRNADGSILFRPGGHGALIENLNELREDIVFIKNIDNVVPEDLRQPTYTYKKVLGGLLISLMEKTYAYLDALSGREPDTAFLEEVFAFARKQLMIPLPDSFMELPAKEQIGTLSEVLNRPMRICGMVRNEGEPGGGPFWVHDDNERQSLQIVESSQIDMNDEEQSEIVRNATHFNPVDLVCSMKDYHGEKFNLLEFVDPQTGFISIKSKDGRDLKAQELPGLWNGAMARWITVFIEVPIETFNPVKTVNDLLRPQHQ